MKNLIFGIVFAIAACLITSSASAQYGYGYYPQNNGYYNNYYGYGNYSYGYYPNVQWYSSGTGLNIGQAYTPDRRNVRIGLNVTFSRPMGYYTYNLQTGQMIFHPY